MISLEQKIFVRQHYKAMTLEEMAEKSGIEEEELINFYSKFNLLPLKVRTDARKPRFKERINQREIFIAKKIPTRPFVRPKAEYTNSPSPYGIADELYYRNLTEQCKF